MLVFHCKKRKKKVFIDRQAQSEKSRVCDSRCDEHRGVKVEVYSREKDQVESKTCVNSCYLKLFSREIHRFAFRIRSEFFIETYDTRDIIFAIAILPKNSYVIPS